jgi:choice-of-anchor B domain-containing protein
VNPSPFFLRSSLLLAIVPLLITAPPAATQDRFGAAVTITDDDEMVVLKPGTAVGPAVAVVYRAGPDGAWTSVARLPKLPGGYPGEALVEVLAAGGDVLLLGSGDPGGREAGHLYQREGERWAPRVRVPLDPTALGVSAALPSGGLDMPTLMRLMGPPARSLALSPDGTRLAVAGGALSSGTVHVLRRAGEAWALEAVLGVDPERAGLGTALAINEDLLLVGTPGGGPGGSVHIFRRSEDGWSREAAIVADSLEADGLLGAAVALSGSGHEAFASAPGRSRVLRFVPGPDHSWARSEELTSPVEDRSDPQGFGTALALDGDRLLVGAPRVDQGRGRVYAFRRADSEWELDRTLAPGDLDRAAFGSALALRGERALIGAPGAYGNDGRAAVFDLDADDGPTWLDPGEELRTVAGTEPVRCTDGEAAGFSCEGVDLVSFLPLRALGAEPGERVSDIWGWTDPETGREYVLAGRTAGLAIVDITEPGVPRLVGLMPANPSGARDIKVYRDHAFMTGDGAGDHGLLVFDLTRLRGVAGSPATFEPDARYDQVSSVHNLVIDTESGFAYTVGTNTGGQSCGGGLHMIDIREPLQPAFAGCYTDTEGLIWTGRTHDAQCTVYRGPDEKYRGRQICFAANETAMRIVDVTDKAAPLPISTASHPGTAYVHQGWLTEDHRYLYVNDELDEIVGTTDRTRTLIYDVAELDDPILVAEHLGPDQATDHNLYIKGTRAYLANYQAGFRVLDVSDPESPVEIGWFDTTPYGENPPGFEGGAWTAWPFFESGMVVVSSMNEGLFIVRPQRPVM